jgi:hypothetical protein
MAHYAFIDSNNIVVKVLTGVDEDVTQDDNGTPVAGIGFTYDAVNDVFVAPPSPTAEANDETE